MATIAESIDNLLDSALAVISRRTSDNFAVIVIGNALTDLRKKYPFFNYIQTKNTQYFEADQIITIDPKINKISENEIARALREFIEKITIAIGRDAGFFFIRELKDHMGWQWHAALKKIDVDLDMLQFSFTFDRIQKLAQQIDSAEIVKKLLKSALDILKQTISYRFAVPLLDRLIQDRIAQHKFLQYITIYDIRFTQGSDEVIVHNAINDVPIAQLAPVIEDILIETNKSLEEQGSFAFVIELNRLLGSEYRVKMEELGFSITIQQYGLQAIIDTVLSTALDILFTLKLHKNPNSLLNDIIKTVAERHGFLNNISIDISKKPGDKKFIIIPDDLHDVSGLEAGRALKLLLRELMHTLDSEDALELIKHLRTNLDSGFIAKLELMGLNLYMLQLRQEMQLSA